MSFEISGKLIEIYPSTNISDKFKKREFVIERTETKNSFDFTDYVKFQLIQDKCSLIDLYKKGDEIKVSFNLRGRKWEKEGAVNYFTNLEAWKIEKITMGQPAQAEDHTFADPEDLQSSKPVDSPSGAEIETDDLPF